MSWGTSAAGKPGAVAAQVRQDLSQYPSKELAAVADVVDAIARMLPPDSDVEISTSGHVDRANPLGNSAEFKVRPIRMAAPIVEVPAVEGETGEPVPLAEARA